MSCKVIIDEVESSGHPFRTKRIYPFMVKWVAPITFAAIFITQFIRTRENGGRGFRPFPFSNRLLTGRA